MHRFSIINSDIFCLGGDEYIYLFSISKMDLISYLKVDKIYFRSIITLPNNSILAGGLGSEGYSHLFQFQVYENNQIIEISRKNQVHSTHIWQLGILNKNQNFNEIISVSDDSYLKIWELYY